MNTMNNSTLHKPHPKMKFTPEEDEKLQELINQYGIKDWSIISNLMKTRNPRQCRERWVNYLSPIVNLSPFSIEEDFVLLKKYGEIGPKLVQISKFMNNRSDTSVKSRFLVLKRRGISLEILIHQRLLPFKPQKTKNVDDIISQIAKEADQDMENLWANENNDNFWSNSLETDFF